MLISTHYTFNGKSYVESEQYDDVVYKLKRANDKIAELEAKIEKMKAINSIGIKIYVE